ncbi:MAG: SdpI family protein [Blautia massiliensis (ex Durand et al. 2017)]
MILWLVPVVSVITCMSIYGLALGMDIDIGVIVNIMVGIMFIILGNYVHKVKQNYTVGMKLPWTLNSEENWNRTNRMTGWILILSGLLFLMNSLLLKTEIVFAVILLVILVPMIYSFILYKKGI